MPSTGRRTCAEKGGLYILGVAREVGHQEGGPDQIAPEVAEFDPAELPAGLAGGVDVFHAIAPADLRREQLGGGLDLVIQEPAELLGVIDDLLILLLRAGDADGLLPPQELGRAFGYRHDVLPRMISGDDCRGRQYIRAATQLTWTSDSIPEI